MILLSTLYHFGSEHLSSLIAFFLGCLSKPSRRAVSTLAVTLATLWKEVIDAANTCLDLWDHLKTTVRKMTDRIIKAARLNAARQPLIELLEACRTHISDCELALACQLAERHLGTWYKDVILGLHPFFEKALRELMLILNKWPHSGPTSDPSVKRPRTFAGIMTFQANLEKNIDTLERNFGKRLNSMKSWSFFAKWVFQFRRAPALHELFKWQLE